MSVVRTVFVEHKVWLIVVVPQLRYVLLFVAVSALAVFPIILIGIQLVTLVACEANVIYTLLTIRSVMVFRTTRGAFVNSKVAVIATYIVIHAVFANHPFAFNVEGSHVVRVCNYTAIVAVVIFVRAFLAEWPFATYAASVLSI